MAQVTVTINDSHVADVRRALCLKYGYAVTNQNALNAHRELLKDLVMAMKRADAEATISLTPPDITVN